MKDYTLVLREHNLKATPQRLAILDIIFLSGHINIDTLYDKVKSKFSSISLATIYKNINAMTKNLLLLEVKLPNEKAVFEIVKADHSHLLCTKCGEVMDVDIDTDKIMNETSSKYNFNINHSDLVFSGNCQACQ